MIITELQTEGIKFERYKKESLISSQFLKNPNKKQNLTFFLIFIQSISPLQWVHAIYKTWLKIGKYIIKKCTK